MDVKKYFDEHKPRTSIKLLSIAIILSLGAGLIQLGIYLGQMIGAMFILVGLANLAMFIREKLKRA